LEDFCVVYIKINQFNVHLLFLVHRENGEKLDSKPSSFVEVLIFDVEVFVNVVVIFLIVFVSVIVLVVAVMPPSDLGPADFGHDIVVAEVCL